MSATLTAAGATKALRVLSARFTLPERGVWFADLDLDPDSIALAPTSGKATLIIGKAPGPVSTVVGTIDPRGTGGFVAKAVVRLVGGAAGWDQVVGRQHFHPASGQLLSTDVYSATAAAVGETIQEAAPFAMGIDYARIAGPARRILDDVEWHVDVSTGVTMIGPQASPAADPTLELLSWDPATKRAELSCDALVLPGTVLTDARIAEQPVTVRDVEQVFGPDGSRATAWCAGNATSRMVDVLKNLVREFGRTAALKVYRYRMIQQDPDATHYDLQAVHSNLGAPDLIPSQVWTGLAGGTAQLAPGTEVAVLFLEGDLTQPIMVAVSNQSLPIGVTLDATERVEVGKTAEFVVVGEQAEIVAIGGGTSPLCTAPWAAALEAAISAWSEAFSSAPTAPVLGAAVAALATAITAALSGIPQATVVTKAG